MDVKLDERERHLLSAGLNEWGGPARPTDTLAVALGFRDVGHLLDEGKRIRARLRDDLPLTSLDAARALAATEIVFASDVFGSGVEWATTTGLADDETIRALRGLQRKLIGEYQVTSEGIA